MLNFLDFEQELGLKSSIINLEKNKQQEDVVL